MHDAWCAHPQRLDAVLEHEAPAALHALEDQGTRLGLAARLGETQDARGGDAVRQGGERRGGGDKGGHVGVQALVVQQHGALGTATQGQQEQ